MNRKLEVEESSGNVFADLGLPTEERLAKALLSRAITNALKERGLTQAQAAAILGTTQPKVSDLVRGNLGSFSMDRLFRYLTALSMDIHIAVTPAASNAQAGRVLVDC